MFPASSAGYLYLRPASSTSNGLWLWLFRQSRVALRSLRRRVGVGDGARAVPVAGCAAC